MQVNILEAQNRLSELIKYAQAGQEVIIASQGLPAVKLVAISNLTAQGHRIGSSEALLAVMAANPRATPGRTKQEVDAYIAEERASWD